MQEFNLKLDKGFMLSLYDIYASRQATDKEVRHVFLLSWENSPFMHQSWDIHGTQSNKKQLGLVLHCLKWHGSVKSILKAWQSTAGGDHNPVIVSAWKKIFPLLYNHWLSFYYWTTKGSNPIPSHSRPPPYPNPTQSLALSLPDSLHTHPQPFLPDL